MLQRPKALFFRLKTLRLRWWFLIVIVMGLGSLIGGVEISSQSAFCGTCHIMGPFYDSWEASEHRTVKCIECHIPPGIENTIMAKMNGAGQVVDDILNRVSMKPSASVTSFSCMRHGCHVREELSTPASTDRAYLFDHEKHLDLDMQGIAIGCATCHSHVRGETHFEVNTNVCVVCHMGKIEVQPDQTILVGLQSESNATANAAENGTSATASTEQDANATKSQHSAGNQRGTSEQDAHVTTPSSDCLSCHEPPDRPFEYRGITVNHTEFLDHGTKCSSCHYGVTEDPKPIGDQECYSCHVFGYEEWTDPVEMHDVHTTGHHKVECFECHGWITHGPATQEAITSEFRCISCHSDQHGIQREAYSQAGGEVLVGHDHPENTEISPMFLTHIGCSACHIKPRSVSSNPTSGATVAAAVPEACDTCHSPGLGHEMIPLWQRSTRDLYGDVSDLLYATRVNRDDARELVAEARRLLELVRLDGSWGVHNPGYTQGLLERAREKLVKAAAIEAGTDEEGGL